MDEVREAVRKANRAYRRSTRRGGYAALRTQRIIARDIIATLEGRHGK